MIFVLVALQVVVVVVFYSSLALDSDSMSRGESECDYNRFRASGLLFFRHLAEYGACIYSLIIEKQY